MRSVYHSELCSIGLQIHNRGVALAQVAIWDAYAKRKLSHALQPGKSLMRDWPLERWFGWYDLTLEVEQDPSFVRQLAGHLENGRDSMSDPALGPSSL